MQGHDGQVYQGEARALVGISLDSLGCRVSSRSVLESSVSRADQVFAVQERGYSCLRLYIAIVYSSSVQSRQLVSYSGGALWYIMKLLTAS